MLRLKAMLLSILASALPAGAEVRLLMVEQMGCAYCAEWDAEVGDAYAMTSEGRIAPLLRTQLREPLPEDVTLDRPALFTPTFVLLNDGAEVGRIEGYVGEDFFWPLLGQLIERLPEHLQEDPAS